MVFFVISDIHGSSTALKKALEIYKAGRFRKLVICGDILYHGARNPLPEGYNPKEVIDLLNNIKEDIIAVKGNCESEVDSMVLDFPIKSEYSHIFTQNLDVFITHGDKYTTDDLSLYKSGSLFLSGHTHIPTGCTKDGVHLLNPGSISLPKGGFEPSYGILKEGSWEVRCLNNQKLILSTDF